MGKNVDILKQNFAHRGLHNKVDLPENSMAAILAAAKAGHGIEIDIHTTKDGSVVVFHDGSLKRMTGKDGKTKDLTASELDEYKLMGTDEKIPTYQQVIDELNKLEKQPTLLVEFKNWDMTDKNLDKAINPVLKASEQYKGSVAYQSFNPLLTKRVKELAPENLSGMLYGVGVPGESEMSYVAQESIATMMMAALAANPLVKPDFVATNTINAEKSNFRLGRIKSIAEGVPICIGAFSMIRTMRKQKAFVKNTVWMRVV